MQLGFAKVSKVLTIIIGPSEIEETIKWFEYLCNHTAEEDLLIAEIQHHLYLNIETDSEIIINIKGLYFDFSVRLIEVLAHVQKDQGFEYHKVEDLLHEMKAVPATRFYN